MSATPLITPFGEHAPVLAEDAYVDRSARIIGQVRLEPASSVWPGAVLRADDDRVVLGRGSAVLDLGLVEAPAGSPVIVEPAALISHKACVHGARIETGALVGIGAIVLDGACIGAGSLVGAGAVVPPGMQVPPATLVLGQPAKVVRELGDDERERGRRQVAEVAAKAAEYLRQQRP